MPPVHRCLWEIEEGVGSPRAGVIFFLFTNFDRQKNEVQRKPVLLNENFPEV